MNGFIGKEKAEPENPRPDDYRNLVIPRIDTSYFAPVAGSDPSARYSWSYGGEDG
jgi:hypothetical protein